MNHMAYTATIKQLSKMAKSDLEAKKEGLLALDNQQPTSRSKFD